MFRRFYTGKKNVCNKNCLFYAKFFEFEEFSMVPFFCSSIQPQHTVSFLEFLKYLEGKPRAQSVTRVRRDNQISRSKKLSCHMLIRLLAFPFLEFVDMERDLGDLERDF